MKAIILSAGRGERMQPLTNSTPKPLLEVDSKSLIEHIIEALVNAGINNNGYATEIEEFGKLFGTPDFKEGTTAFLEKRKPNF